MTKDAVIRDAAKRIRELLPIVTRLLSDEFTAEERHKVRTLSADDVFYLKNELARLCSEKAREVLPPAGDSAGLRKPGFREAGRKSGRRKSNP